MPGLKTGKRQCLMAEAIVLTVNFCLRRFLAGVNPPGSEESNGSFRKKCFGGQRKREKTMPTFARKHCPFPAATTKNSFYITGLGETFK